VSVSFEARVPGGGFARPPAWVCLMEEELQQAKSWKRS